MGDKVLFQELTYPSEEVWFWWEELAKVRTLAQVYRNILTSLLIAEIHMKSFTERKQKLLEMLRYVNEGGE